MWRVIGWILLGSLALLPLFLAAWLIELINNVGNAVFGWLVVYVFGAPIMGVSTVFLLFAVGFLGFLFDVPYIGAVFQKIFGKVPFFGPIIKNRQVLRKIQKIWQKTGCGPLYVPFYNDNVMHPAAITSVFLTDFGYRAIVLIATFPPQVLYYNDTTIVEFGLPFHEMTAIQISLGFGAKRTDLRGIIKRSTLRQLIIDYNLYDPNGGDAGQEAL